MADDGRKRPRFEDAATLISEPPVIRPNAGMPARQPSRPAFGPAPGAPHVDTMETETRIDPRADAPAERTPPPQAGPRFVNAAPVAEDGATRIAMKAVGPQGDVRQTRIGKFDKQPHELRGEPVATPIAQHASPLPPTPSAPAPQPMQPAAPAAPTRQFIPSQQAPRAHSASNAGEPSNLAVVPVDGTNPDSRLVLVHDPDGTAAQQYRLIKFKLKEHGDPRAIAITCARSGEGATSLAANLALALAEGRRTRVALVEANFRTPALAKAFGITVESGLTEEIRAHRKDPGALWHALELGTGFHLLPCGKPADNPAALLSSEEFARLIQELRLYYDFVIIDTPATLAAADINIIQDLVDGVVLAARAGTSSKATVRKAITRLSSKNVVGVVLIGT